MILSNSLRTANAIERPVIDTGDVGDDFPLAIRRIDRKSQLAFYSPKLDGALGASVEQFHQLLIQPIDFVSPIFYIHSDSPNREPLVYSREPKAAMITARIENRNVRSINDSFDRKPTNGRARRPSRQGRVTGIILDLGDDATADNRRVGVLPNFGDVFRSRDTEADGNRQIGETPDSLNKVSRGFRQALPERR